MKTPRYPSQIWHHSTQHTRDLHEEEERIFSTAEGHPSVIFFFFLLSFLWLVFASVRSLLFLLDFGESRRGSRLRVHHRHTPHAHSDTVPHHQISSPHLSPSSLTPSPFPFLYRVSRWLLLVVFVLVPRPGSRPGQVCRKISRD